MLGFLHIPRPYHARAIRRKRNHRESTLFRSRPLWAGLGGTGAYDVHDAMDGNTSFSTSTHECESK